MFDRKAVLDRYYKNNRKKVLARNKAWWKAHPKEAGLYSKRYRERNKEKRREATRKWRAANPRHRKKYQKQWQSRNLHRYRDYCARRRDIKAQDNDQRIQPFLKNLRRRKRIPCYYCTRRFPFNSGEIDHITPLSKGGRHILENLCFSCGPCNASKHAKSIGEWQPNGQQVLVI